PVNSKPISYRDAFVNSDARWEYCLREWGLKDLEMEFEELNADTTCEADADDGILS
ncbi:hypothetical protein MKX03_034410, partial [Papaver bracteatum]